MFVSTVKPVTTEDGRNGWLYTSDIADSKFYEGKYFAVSQAKRDLKFNKIQHLKTYTLRGRVDYNGYSPQVREIKKLEERMHILEFEKDSLKRSRDYWRNLCLDYKVSFLSTKELLDKSRSQCKRMLSFIESVCTCTD